MLSPIRFVSHPGRDHSDENVPGRPDPRSGGSRRQSQEGGEQEVKAALPGSAEKAAERRGASVPPDLDGRELPEVGVTHVQHFLEGRGAPLERGYLVPRGATGSHHA